MSTKIHMSRFSTTLVPYSAGMARGACSRLTLRPGWHFCTHMTSSTLTSSPGAAWLMSSKRSNLPEELPCRFHEGSHIRVAFSHACGITLVLFGV